jgi:XTP/dITP diphosphohydrolase
MGCKLLVGTNNAHKVAEIRAILAGFECELATPKSLGIVEEPVEDGETFRDNALIKARFFFARTGLPCLADDSGLVVDALDGLPGVYSSRYADTDAKRIARLLAELEQIPDERRTARFMCTMAMVRSGQSPLETVETGICEGHIAHASRGHGGFGYDPVFVVRDLSKTMAEMTADEKNSLSHRARALAAMRPHLETLCGIVR